MSDVSAFQPLACETVKRPGLPGWVTPIVAERILAETAPPEAADDITAHIRSRLFDALSTGQVRAMIDNGEIRRSLKDADFLRIEFSFDFQRDGLKLFDGPGGLFDCWINERELHAFAAAKQSSRRKMSGARRAEICAWIVSFIDGGEYHSKDATIPLIEKRFGISQTEATRLFDLAKKNAKRPDISKPGRKPKFRNQTTI